MNELSLRRVIGGPQPAREVVRWRRPGPMEIWRSHGSAAGVFGVDATAAEMVLRAGADAAGAPPPEGLALPVPSPVMEYLSLDEEPRAVDVARDLAGPWGALLTACRSVLAQPGEPLAAISVVGLPPDRARLELLGTGALRLGFGALQAGIRWERDRVPIGYAETRLQEGEVEAGPGWARTLDLELPPGGAPTGDAVAFASFAIFDEGVWFPVSVEVAVRHW